MSDDSNSSPTLERVFNGRRRLGQLLITRGPGQGRRYELEHSSTLGRAPELAIPTDDVGVSRAHARVDTDANGQYQVQDLESKNGTFVNDVRVHQRVLQGGDRIRLGPGVEFEFRQFDALDPEVREAHRHETLGRLYSRLNPELTQTLSALASGLHAPQSAQQQNSLGLAQAANAGLELCQWLADLCTERMQRQSFDLAALVRRSAAGLQRWVGHHCQVEIEAGGVVFVHGYVGDILLALLDLCSECAASTPAAGSLVVRVAASNGVGGPGASLSLAHSSVAAAASDVLGAGAANNPHAAGIPLSFVREVASLHGGELRVIAEAPGTLVWSLCFEDTLPAEFRQASTLEAVGNTPRSKARLLLAQSDPIVRRMTARLLRDTGYDVVEVGGAREALDRKLELQPELAIVDADLPDMAGAALISRLRTRQAGLSGIVLDENNVQRRAGSSLPPSAFPTLIKPVTFEQLVHAVEGALQASRSP
jgi:CheY-like chemotaxis protein